MSDHTLSDHTLIEGIAAPLPIPNLDTDQIMPKQFLRGIDKAGLARGLLYDLRFDGEHRPRPECLLNQPGYQGAAILVGGSNFGCGSSREHAVWGLQQFGIRAVIAPSFGEIFYSNAMNNRLMLVMLPDAAVQVLTAAASDPVNAHIAIDVERMVVRGAGQEWPFALSERHRRMVMDGLDMIGATLALQQDIDGFQQRHWQQRPWLKDVAAVTQARLNAA